jgi:hypothetical protein
MQAWKASCATPVVCCAGNAAFKPFAELTDVDYELGLRSKLMGQVSIIFTHSPFVHLR